MPRRASGSLSFAFLLSAAAACGSQPGSPEAEDRDSEQGAGQSGGGDAGDEGTYPDQDSDFFVDGGDDRDALLDTDTGAFGDTPDAGEDIDADPPQWPPPHGFGEPGWRDSDEPLCLQRGDIERGYTVWADERGVFTVASNGGPVQAAVLLLNDGSGWTTLSELSGPEYFLAGRDLVGIPGGQVWLTSGAGCTVATPPDYELTPCAFVGVREITASLGGTAFGLVSDAPGLVFFDGDAWGPTPGDPMPFDPGDLNAIHAAGTVVFVGGANATVLTWDGTAWTVHRLPSLSAVADIWAFSETDAWVVLLDGSLFHFDGEEWSPFDWASSVSSPCSSAWIEQLWGFGGSLFALAEGRLLRISADAVDLIGDWTEDADGNCAQELGLERMWGSSETDLYLSVRDLRVEDSACEAYLVYWDGAEFHWF